MCLKEKCPIGPVHSNNSSSTGSSEERRPCLRPWLTEQRVLHHPPRGIADAGGHGWRWFQLRSPNWKLEERTSAGRVQGMRGFSVLLGSPPKITHFTCKNDSAGTWWDWPSVLWLETALGLLSLCESMGCSENVVKLGRDPEWCRADAHASNVTRSSWRCACIENQTLWTTWPSINKDRPVC